MKMIMPAIENIKPLQKRLLENAKIISKILEDADIPHCIAFGSLLGSVRHSGFIPWDDDFDFFIDEDFYEKATDILLNKLPEYLFLHGNFNDEMVFTDWNCIRDLRVPVVERQIYNIDNYIHNYKFLNIDLYKLRNLKNKYVGDYMFTKEMQFYERKIKVGILSSKDALTFLKNKSDDYYNLFENKGDKSDGETDVCMCCIGLKQALLKEHLFPLVKGYFLDDENFWGPLNSDAVLSELYGDYMKLPPAERRIGHFSSFEILR